MKELVGAKLEQYILDIIIDNSGFGSKGLRWSEIIRIIKADKPEQALPNLPMRVTRSLKNLQDNDKVDKIIISPKRVYYKLTNPSKFFSNSEGNIFMKKYIDPSWNANSETDYNKFLNVIKEAIFQEWVINGGMIKDIEKSWAEFKQFKEGKRPDFFSP